VSYFRGDIYIWGSGDAVHVWSQPQANGEYKHKIAIPMEMFHQLAVMGVCQMIEDGGLEKAVHDASKSGNSGGFSVKAVGQELLNRLRSMLPTGVAR
jgi:hypothetical protein